MWEIRFGTDQAHQWVPAEGFLGISTSEFSSHILCTHLKKGASTFHAGPPAPNGVHVSFEHMIVAHGDEEYLLRLADDVASKGTVYYDASHDGSGNWCEYTPGQAWIIKEALAAGLSKTTLHLPPADSYEISLKSNPRTQTKMSTLYVRAIRIDAHEEEEEEGKDDEEKYDAPIPKDYACSIGFHLMIDPVTIASGHTYERSQIERWLRKKSVCPITGAALAHMEVTPNLILAREIKEWKLAHKKVSLEPTNNAQASQSGQRKLRKRSIDHTASNDAGSSFVSKARKRDISQASFHAGSPKPSPKPSAAR